MTSKNRIPSVTLKDLYKNLHKQELYKDLSFKDFKILSIKIFKDIISDIFNSKEVNLPHGMGKLFLVPYITKGNVIDYGLTRKFGKKIYITNLHSDGKSYKLKWVKNSSLFVNKTLFEFKMTRKNARTLANLIKSNKIKVFKKYV